MKARVIALYLPQYHPIPENDKWWGKGFTEWTNVGKARKFFKQHYQPRVPADLGYYDLRLSETRQAQADLAREYGVEGFLYWHYWFGNGKRLIERPFNEVLECGKPDFPFALAWANESWRGFAHGLRNRNTLIEQLYPGEQDYIDHFNAVLPAFKDNRYITVDNKPMFMIYKPVANPGVLVFMNTWRRLANDNGLGGIYFVAQVQNAAEFGFESEELVYEKLLGIGFDAVNFVRLTTFLEKQRSFFKRVVRKIRKIFWKVPLVFNYTDMTQHLSQAVDSRLFAIPTIVPGWDHTPRSGIEGLVIHSSTPDKFGRHVEEILDTVKNKPLEHRLVFIKSWNEWAEGNYMEPDLRWGRQYLKELLEKLK